MSLLLLSRVVSVGHLAFSFAAAAAPFFLRSPFWHSVMLVAMIGMFASWAVFGECVLSVLEKRGIRRSYDAGERPAEHPMFCFVGRGLPGGATALWALLTALSLAGASAIAFSRRNPPLVRIGGLFGVCLHAMGSAASVPPREYCSRWEVADSDSAATEY